MENTEIKMKRKIVKVEMNNKKFQLDSSSDATLINEQTWKKIGKSTLLKTEKNAHGITRNKFEGKCYTNITFIGKTM